MAIYQPPEVLKYIYFFYLYNILKTTLKQLIKRMTRDESKIVTNILQTNHKHHHGKTYEELN